MAITINTPKLRNYLLLGGGCYIVFMLIGIPASLVAGYLLGNTQANPTFKLQNLRGSIWQGEAQEAWLGRSKLGSLTWGLNSAGLLVGNLDLDLHLLGQNNIQGNGNLALGLGGKLALQNVEARLPAEQLNGLFGGFPVNISGNLLGKITALEIKKDALFRGKGRVVWQQAALRAPYSIELGDVLVEMEPQNNNSKITITDQNEQGQLKINVKLDIQASGKYRIEGTLAPRVADQPKLQEFLAFIGRPDSAGNYWISRSGQLAGW
ncbi:MAG: type II secretion system protein N [Gammaproteobacteria bacterium]|nr:type II secretion system protein N [Gammaproteobacteria bacterium]